MILCYGSVTKGANIEHTFPISFKTIVRMVTGTHGSGATSTYCCNIKTLSKTGFTSYLANNYDNGYYMAIGY